MTSRWRNLLRFTGLVIVIASIFIELPSPWPWVIWFLGLGMFLAAGGFG